jgi:hypothetical protein
MPASTEPRPIEYGVHVESDAEEMARLLGEAFSRRDPPAVAVGLTPSELEAFVRRAGAKVDELATGLVSRAPRPVREPALGDDLGFGCGLRRVRLSSSRRLRSSSRRTARRTKRLPLRSSPSRSWTASGGSVTVTRVLAMV